MSYKLQNQNLTPPNPSLKKRGEEAGFTLLETLLYIALLSFFLASLVGITYQSLDSAGQIGRKIAIQQEANFILRKMDWAITGASDITGTADHLTITRTVSPTSVEFISDTLNKGMDIKAELGQMKLNSSNVKVENVNFVISGSPKKVVASFDINGENFSLTRYLR